MKEKSDAILGPKDGNDVSSSFVAAIRDYPSPPNFRTPEGIPNYIRDTNPINYLSTFRYSIGTTNTMMPILCMTFPIHLRGKAKRWFHHLPQGSISHFRDRIDFFYACVYPQKKFTKSDLMNIRQNKEKSLKSFLQRYTKGKKANRRKQKIEKIEKKIDDKGRNNPSGKSRAQFHLTLNLSVT